MSDSHSDGDSDGDLARMRIEPDALEREVFEARLRARMFGGDPELPRVDRFVLERMLGAGGMGTVWLARDENLDRSVALKLVRSRSAAAGERMRLREARGLARIAHPNVISVYDVGEHEGRVWLAMEFVPGRTLRECASELGRDTLLRHWLTAGRGLTAIHAAGLVHRDIKPDNVLLGDDGRVRVIDLGLVRTAVRRDQGLAQGPDLRTHEVAMTPGFVGTHSYAAPEQRRGEPVDARADQYAFCVSLLESLRAAKPSPGREHEPLSAALRDVLASGRAPDPAQRFESMTELLDALERSTAATALPARSTGPKRTKRLALTALVVLAGAAGALAFASSSSLPAPAPPWSECMARASPVCEGAASEVIELVLSCADPSCDELEVNPRAALLEGDRLPFDLNIDNRGGEAVELRWHAADASRSGSARLAPGRHPLPPHWGAVDLPVCVDVIDARGRVRSVTIDRTAVCADP